MSKNNDTYQPIEDYLNGELSPNEQLAFENELLTNSELKEQFELHQLANDLVLESRFEHLSSLVNVERRKYSSRKNIQKGLLGLSTILLITITSYFILSKDDSKKTTMLSKDEIKVTDSVNVVSNSEQPIIEVQHKKVSTKQQKLVEPPTKSSTPAKVNDTLVVVDKVKETVKAPTPEVDLKTEAFNQPKIVDPCSEIAISYKLNFEAICENTSNGEINVTSIKGGQPPYTTHIYNEYNEAVINGQLGNGIYKAQVVDKNNCKSNSKTIELLATRCLEDYSLSRSYNSPLTIPAFDENITFRVLKNNAVYFEKQYNAFEPIQWNGENLNGQVIDGYYLLIVTTESGNKLKGSITILP